MSNDPLNLGVGHSSDPWNVWNWAIQRRKVKPSSDMWTLLGFQTNVTVMFAANELGCGEP